MTQDPRLAWANEVILDLLVQGTGGTVIYDGEEAIDNMCMSAYENACEYLEDQGILQQINPRLYRIVETKEQHNV